MSENFTCIHCGEYHRVKTECGYCGRKPMTPVSDVLDTKHASERRLIAAAQANGLHVSDLGGFARMLFPKPDENDPDDGLYVAIENDGAFMAEDGDGRGFRTHDAERVCERAAAGSFKRFVFEQICSSEPESDEQRAPFSLATFKTWNGDACDYPDVVEALRNLERGAAYDWDGGAGGITTIRRVK